MDESKKNENDGVLLSNERKKKLKRITRILMIEQWREGH